LLQLKVSFGLQAIFRLVMLEDAPLTAFSAGCWLVLHRPAEALEAGDEGSLVLLIFGVFHKWGMPKMVGL